MFEEEAIEEEIWEAVMNLACAEEHLLETALNLADKEENVEEILKQLIEMNDLRKQRKMLVNQIIELRNSKGEEQGSYRTGKGELWCSIKHLLIVKMHLFETVQKYMVLHEKDGDKKWLQKAVQLIGFAREIHGYIKSTIEEVFPKGKHQ